MEITGSVLIIIGGLFMFLGALGVFRMPDVINRLQAGTKATTLGFLSIIAGTIFLRPEWWNKLLLLAFFVVLTNPIGSHNLARASHTEENPLISGTDALRDEEAER